MASAKKPKFDTSFNFGANAARRDKKPHTPQSRSTRQAYAVAYREGRLPRQTGAAGGS